MDKILSFIIIAILVLVIDLIWLRLFLGKYFGQMVMKIQGGTEQMVLNKGYAIVSYLLIIFSIYYFLVLKDEDDDEDKYLDAFLLGIFVYGIFEYTSAAIFKDWEPLALFVDTFWGGILYLSVYSIYKEIKKIL